MRRPDRRSRLLAMAACRRLVTVAARWCGLAALAAGPRHGTDDAARKVADAASWAIAARSTSASSPAARPAAIAAPAEPPDQRSMSRRRRRRMCRSTLVRLPSQATITAAPSAIRPGWAGFTQTQTGFPLAGSMGRGRARSRRPDRQHVAPDLGPHPRRRAVPDAVSASRSSSTSRPGFGNLRPDASSTTPCTADGSAPRSAGRATSTTTPSTDDPIGYIDFIVSRPRTRPDSGICTLRLLRRICPTSRPRARRPTSSRSRPTCSTLRPARLHDSACVHRDRRPHHRLDRHPLRRWPSGSPPRVLLHRPCRRGRPGRLQHYTATGRAPGPGDLRDDASRRRHDDAGAVGLHYAAITGSRRATTSRSYEADLNTAGIVAALVDPPDPVQPDGSTVTTELDVSSDRCDLAERSPHHGDDRWLHADRR